MEAENINYTVSWGQGAREVEPSEEKAWYTVGTTGYAWNQWQISPGTQSNVPAELFSAVYACRKVLAETVAGLKAYHYRVTDRGKKERQPGTDLGRVLRYPNEYESRVDFFLNVVDALLCDGNAYVYKTFNERGGIADLTHIRKAYPFVDPEGTRVFYSVGYDHTQLPRPEEIDPARMVPANRIIHLRLFTPRHPLIGESPLVAARVHAETGLALTNSAFSFHNRAARPSGYLRIPGRLNAKTREDISAAWEKNYSGLGFGGTAVLPENAEWKPMTMTAVDAEVISQYKLTVEDVARVYRVPLFMLGNMDKATFSNVEQMTRSFYVGGLSFYLELIEAAFGAGFRLPANEYVEFDVESGLLRGELKERIEAYARGVQGGIYAPNEARVMEGLEEAEWGDQPMVQQQMVPLSYAAQQTVENNPAPGVPAPEDDEDEDEEDMAEEARAYVRRAMGVPLNG